MGKRSRIPTLEEGGQQRRVGPGRCPREEHIVLNQVLQAHPELARQSGGELLDGLAQRRLEGRPELALGQLAAEEEGHKLALAHEQREQLPARVRVAVAAPVPLVAQGCPQAVAQKGQVGANRALAALEAPLRAWEPTVNMRSRRPDKAALSEGAGMLWTGTPVNLATRSENRVMTQVCFALEALIGGLHAPLVHGLPASARSARFAQGRGAAPRVRDGSTRVARGDSRGARW